MAGRRLVDAAKLFNASKSIAGKHIALRSQQLDVFNKTSTLAKAVKNQTDRVTLTAQAAVALSKRFSEDLPSYASTTTSQFTKSQNDENIPNKDTVRGTRANKGVQVALEQDHHYDRSSRNTQAEPLAEEELDVQQEGAKRQPLPDGTIPSAGLTLEQESKGQDTFSERPVPEPQKESLVEERRGIEVDEGFKPVESSESTIPIPSKSTEKSTKEALGSQQRLEFQKSSSSNTTEPTIPSPQVEKLNKGHDQDVFYTRSKEPQPDLSSLPKAKIPKHTEDKQESDNHVDGGQMNQDVYYARPVPGQDQAQREQFPCKPTSPKLDSVPEGINTDVFRTKRVAKMLGGNPYTPNPHSNLDAEKGMHEFASKFAKDVDTPAEPMPQTTSAMGSVSEKASYELRESRVPSSRFGRLWQYAGLGTSMAFGAVGESLRRVTGNAAAAGGSLMLSPGNMEILVAKLSRMRGAALKLGQMISFQDIKMLPPEIHDVLQRVQDSADYMPASQRNKVLANNLGSDWRDLFDSFEDVPIAAASIGQVHKATLRSTKQSVAVKVQYPGVSNSIDSDLSNLSILLTASRLLPKGLYLDKTIANARTELGWECDYKREAECQTRFRDLLADDTDVFTVPKVFSEASGREVLTAELMHGVGVTKLRSLSQDQRDWIGTQILRLCLREIVEFKFMQTDPNWTNFLYNEQHKKIELLDFGASRDYPDEFVGPYVDILIAASQNNKSVIRDLSIQLGYLTGAESQAMLEAHVQSVLTLAEPFTASGPEIYDFRDQTITDRVRSLIPVMVHERLAPPPEETYSLHRKLSGAFLLCARLGSRVPCRDLFEQAIQTYTKGGKMK